MGRNLNYCHERLSGLTVKSVSFESRLAWVVSSVTLIISSIVGLLIILANMTVNNRGTESLVALSYFPDTCLSVAFWSRPTFVLYSANEKHGLARLRQKIVQQVHK